MTTPRPTFSELPVAEIIVASDRLRVISEAKVVALMELIEGFGFIGRITVRRAGKVNTLIDGAHRLEAMTRLGRETIPTDVLECSLSEAQQLEVTGNLLSGMTPLQDAIFLAAWQDQQEKLHPELRRGMPGNLVANGSQRSFSSVVDVVSEARQISPRQIRKIIQAARKLSTSEKVALQGVECKLPLDDIIKIGNLTDANEREAVVRKLSLGASKSVSQARRAWATELGPAAEPVGESTKDAAFKALLKAWQRAPLSARKRFLFEAASEVFEVQNKGVPLNKWAEADDV